MSGLYQHRQDFFDRWPVGKALENALRSAQNKTPLFYFAEAEDDDLNRCSWVLGRLGVDLEKLFGIASEILILFSPYDDLQRRTYNALTERLRNEVARQQSESAGRVRFTPDPSLALLYSPDPMLQEKISTWNSEGSGSLVAALSFEGRDREGIRTTLTESLHSVLSERDLYQGRNPVSGNDFFGRDETLRSLRAAFKDGHSAGLFGLRRSGKTSVIQEFRRRNVGQSFAVVVSDLEATASLSELPRQISADLGSTLREMKIVDPHVWLGSPDEQTAATFTELGSRIRKVAEKNSQFTFVFAFDEIESLVPLVRTDAMVVRTFLGAIRRAAQGSTNVCLLLTGVTNRFFRDSMLDLELGIENPMLGFVDEFFLGPFDDHEVANLLRKLGRGMMLDWDDAALAKVNTATGGYPFLIRDLASVARGVARDHPAGAGERSSITSEIVDRAIEAWRDQAAELWGQIMQTLAVHHELMAEMASAESDDALQEWLRLGDDAERAARALEGLGLVTRASDRWQRSQALLSLQGLKRPRSIDLEQLRARRAQASDVRALAGQPEGVHLEFKSTARVDLATKEKSDAIRATFVKTVAAFLNTDGGDLLVGVADDGSIVGVEIDIKASNRSQDKYELYLWDALKNAIEPAVIAAAVQITFVPIDEKLVCWVSVGGSAEGVWCDDGGADRFFVRNGNETIALRNRDVAAYLQRRTT